MIRVGLTGGIASGKSTVADELAARGAVIIDADILAREVVEPGTVGLRAVQERFGSDVIRDDGSLDREALGRIVFADQAARRDLEAIIHPRVRARADEIAARAAGAAQATGAPRAADGAGEGEPPGTDDVVVVHVIPLLVETGQQDAFDLVVVVDVDPDVQVERLQARNGYDRSDAVARIAAQAARADRLAAADVVIDNSGTPADLKPQIDRLWARLTGAQLEA